MLVYFSFDPKDTVSVSKIAKIAKKLEESNIICWPPGEAVANIASPLSYNRIDDEDDDATIDENETDDDEIIIDQLAASESQDNFPMFSVPADFDTISDVAAEKLESSSIVLMFLSASYQNAVNSSRSPLNSCRYEFLTVFNKTKSVIPIVIDDYMKSRKNWQSRVAVALTDYLYFDLSDESLYENTDELLSEKTRVIVNCISQLGEDASVKPEASASSNINAVIGSQLVSSSSIPSSSVLSEYCPIHHYHHRYSLYCQDCQLPLCVLCYHGNSSSHQSHRVCNLFDLKNGYTDDKHGKMISFMNEYLLQMNEEQKKSDQLVTDLSVNKSSALTTVGKVFGVIKQSLEDRYHQYKETIEKEDRERVGNLFVQQSLRKEIRASLSSLTTESELLFSQKSQIKDDSNEELDSNELRYVLSALKLEQEILKIHEKKAPLDLIFPLSAVSSSFGHTIQESEVLSLKERIHSFGTLGGEKQLQLSLLQKHSLLLASLSELLQCPPDVKIHYFVDYPLILQSMLEEDFSSSSLFEIVYIKYLEEIIVWLKDELSSSVSSSVSLYCLQILISPHYSVIVSPLLPSTVSKTIRNTEFSFSCNGEFTINYKKFRSCLSLEKGELIDLLPTVLFPGSRILFGNQALVFPLIEMIKEIPAINISVSSKVKAPFQLIYRGTRDGMTIPSFRKAVYSHRNLLIIMKCLDGNIFGAFTSFGFSSSIQAEAKNDSELEVLSPARKAQKPSFENNELEMDKKRAVYRRDSRAFLFSLKNPLFFHQLLLHLCCLLPLPLLPRQLDQSNSLYLRHMPTMLSKSPAVISTEKWRKNLVLFLVKIMK
jgi:hypothetical protein